MSYKPVDTAIIMTVGPCIDDTDFKTLEEAIAYNATGMDVSLIVEKTDGTSTATAITLTSGGANDWTHKDGGYYEVEITAAQNAEEGIAYLRGVCTGVLPFESPRYDIVSSNVYNSIIAGTDNLQVDTVQVSGTAQTANDNSADINAILLDTAEIGAAGAGLTAIPWNAAWDAEVESECTDALNTYDPPTRTEATSDKDELLADHTLMKQTTSGTYNRDTDSLEAIRDRGDTAWITGTGGSDRLLMIDTTIATLSSQTSFTLTDGSSDDNAYNNCTIVIEDVSTSAQKAVGLISAYTGATKTVTLKYDPAIFTMAATDKVYILAENSLKATLANRQLSVAADGDIAGNIDGNVDGTIGELAAQAKLDVNAECDTALADYDAPTNAEMASAFTEIKGATWSSASDTLEHIRDKQTDIETDTAEIGVAGAGLTSVPWNSAWDAEVESECTDALNAYDPPTNTEMEARTLPSADYVVTTDTIAGVTTVTNLTNAPTAGDLTATMKASVNAEVDTALSDYDPPTRAEATSDKDEILADHTTMKQTTAGSYNRDTDSLEAIRDRGDAAWITGGGSSITEILNIQVLIPYSIDLADTATVRIGLGLTNMVDDLPTTAEITPGTISIDRKAIGGTSWISVISDAACSEAAGLIYYDEVFDSGTGYAAGDSIRIIFKSQSITVGANDYEITGTDGWTFQTSIREAMRGTDSAALASVCTETRLAELDAANLPAEIDGIQGTDGRVLISTDAQDLSASLVVDAEDSVCDALLTGTSHNTATSLGRRIREIAGFFVRSGTAQAGSTNTITLDAGASAIDDMYVPNLITIVEGTGAGQARTIIIYNGTTKVATVSHDWLTTPDNTSEFQIIANEHWLHSNHGYAQAGSASTITLASTASATDDIYNGNMVLITSGVGTDQARRITDYDGATKVATISPDWEIQPTTASVYHIEMDADVLATIDSLSESALADINAEVDTALADYDPPTRAEATADKDEIITEVNANETKIDALQVDVTSVLEDTGTTIPGTITALQSDVTAIRTNTDNLPSGIAKNVALPDFSFYMVLTSDHVTGATGQVVTGTISQDGGDFAALTNSIAEISNGMYSVDLTQAEMNADVITLRFTAALCDQRIITIYTS